MQNLENKKSIFIQLSTPNENLVRYFCIGNYDNNNLFTGQVYGYEGGGEFSDQFIYKNKFLPEYDTSGEPLDWECNEELFNFLSIERFDDLDDSIRKILDFDSALLQWYVLDEKLSIFDDINLYTENINCNPPSYGLTSWDDTEFKTWSIEELKLEIKKQSKAVLLEYCSDHIEHHKAFPIDMIVLSDNEYEVKIEFSEYENILGDDFKKFADYILVSEKYSSLSFDFDGNEDIEAFHARIISFRIDTNISIIATIVDMEDCYFDVSWDEIKESVEHKSCNEKA